MRVGFTILVVILLTACALFTPEQREDVQSLVTQQREQWLESYKAGYVTKEELDEALGRLAAIDERLQRDGTASEFWDLLLAFGIGAAGGLGTGPAAKGTRAVVTAIKKKRAAKAAAKVAGF